MTKPTPAHELPRAELSSELRERIKQTYELPVCFIFISMIETHLEKLNACGEYQEAHRWLAEQETLIKTDFDKRQREARQARMHLVIRIVGPIVGIIIFKLLAMQLGYAL